MSQDREQSIREGAYLIWEREGRPDGQNLAHWLKAEVDLAPQPVVGAVKDAKPKKPAAARARRPRAAPPPP